MSKERVLALADSVHEAGARLVDAIPDAWWLATACDLTSGPEAIRQAVHGVGSYAIWRERGDEAFPEAPHGMETALIVADSMAISVAVLLKSGPGVVGLFADRASRAHAASLTRGYMDVRGSRFLRGVV